MLKKLSKNKFFKFIFVNLIYLSLSLIRKTSNWSGVNEEVIEKQLQDNKSIIDVAHEETGINKSELKKLLDPSKLTKGGISE